MSEKNKKNSHPAFHGSDIEKIAKIYGIQKENILEFGGNVNPLGLPASVKQALAENPDIMSHYPDREYQALRQVIADYCGTEMSHVVVGNGSTELISLLVSHRNAKHALILGPTYSEYKRELSLTGGKLSSYYLDETQDFCLNLKDLECTLTQDIDFLILCNPNNPTSSALNTRQLRELLSLCQMRDIFVMIDETYVEFAPEMEQITAIPLTSQFSNLMVIRGVSKFFAAPGLRLGYGVTSNQEFLKTLKKYQNPWSLNNVAAFAGTFMFQDKEFIKATRDLILSERSRCLDILKKFRYAKTYPAYGNFILVKILKEGLTSFDVFEHAIRQGIMIRDCSSFDGLPGEYIRFCILRPDENDRLLNCLSDLLK